MGTFSKCVHVPFRFILIKTKWGSFGCYKRIGVLERLSNLPKVTQLIGVKPELESRTELWFLS